MGKKCNMLYTDDERGIASALKNMWMVKTLTYTGQEDILPSLKDLLGHLKIDYLKHLKMMRRRESRIYNELTTY